MSDQEFSKVSPDRSERKTGEAPLIGRVHRTPESGVARKRGGGQRRSRKKKVHGIVKAWSILFAAVAALVLVAVSIYALKNQTARSGGKTNSTTQFTDLAKSFPEANESELPTLSRERALEIVASALANRDPLKFDAYFIPPRMGTASEAIEKLEDLISAEGPIVGTEWLGSKYANNQVFGEVVVSREHGGKNSNRLAQLLPQPGNEWLIDFDSFMRTSSSDWKLILDGEVPVAEVRVIIAPDSYYNGVFSDDRKWQAFALASPDAWKNTLYGYTKRGSPQLKAIKRILSTGESMHRVTLEIKKLPEAGDRQYEISRVFSENWFLGDEPFDESF